MAFTSDKLERARDDLLEAVRNADADLADKLVAKDNPTGSAFAHIRMLVRMAPAKRSQGENLHIRDDRRPVLGRRSPGHKGMVGRGHRTGCCYVGSWHKMGVEHRSAEGP